ncbi:MAG: carboxymuconolactone decarboxylase family protein [Chloroflexi bacterium]|nr:carboxymuconolactone decarboxylase family protein [Chloroflexota bacterium]MBV9602748.1 carboxymuconolactone decarboxylase family protein [Chloroflexota bacterium]
MARVEYPNVDSPDAQQMVEQIRKERGGRFPHLFHMQLYNPAIADGWLRLGSAVRFKSELDDATRELAICLVARTTGAEYEWRAHRRIALEHGFSEAALDGLLDWRSGEFDARQRAVLALAEQLTTNVAVDDATFKQASDQLSPRQMVELVTTVAYYNMVSRFLVGLQIDLE